MDNRSGDVLATNMNENTGEQKMEEIRANIEETRTSLADRLGALQDKALGTVEAAQATVEQTVTSVQQTVDAAKRTFDLRYQTEERPWLMVGLATAAGAVTGYCLGGGSADRNTSHTPPLASSGISPAMSAHIRESRPGLFDEEWGKLKGMVVGTGMAMLRDWLKETAPGLSTQIDDLMEGATSKLGGTYVRAPLAPSSYHTP